MIKRYLVDYDEIIPFKSGDYVLYEDHEADKALAVAQARREALEEAAELCLKERRLEPTLLGPEHATGWRFAALALAELIRAIPPKPVEQQT